MTRSRMLSVSVECFVKLSGGHRTQRSNSVPSRLTHVHFNAMLSCNHSTLYAPESPELSPVDSEESWECDDDEEEEESIDNDADNNNKTPEKPRKLQVRRPIPIHLPIYGNVALRRAIHRGRDPFDIQRQQRSQLHHEIELRNGPLRNVNTSFHAINFADGPQPRSHLTRILAGEPISPKSLPRVEQMSLREYEDVYGETGIRSFAGWREVERRGGGGGRDFDIVAFTYVPTLSAPCEEGMFAVDPFKGHPHSAGLLDRERKAEWLDGA